MAKTAKLRERARDQERKGNWKDALSLYEKIVEGEAEEDPDLTLLNKIGDLRLRAGRIDGAVHAWERAAASYAESGLPNNAIALCRKVQRVAPDRIEVYRQLGRLSAANGFLADARDNFLEYATRKQRLGDMDASFAALAEFADLFPDDTGLRRSLAEQLVTHGRQDQAARQYVLLRDASLRKGDDATAEEARARLSELGAEEAPPAGGSASAPASAPGAVAEGGIDAAALPGLEPTGMEMGEPDGLDALPMLDMEPRPEAHTPAPEAETAARQDRSGMASEDDTDGLIDIAPLAGLEATALEPGHGENADVEVGEGSLDAIDAGSDADEGLEAATHAHEGLADPEDVAEEELSPFELHHPGLDGMELVLEEPADVDADPARQEGDVSPAVSDVDRQLEAGPSAVEAIDEACLALNADPRNLEALHRLLGDSPGERESEVEAAVRAVPGALAARGEHALALQATQLLLGRWPTDVRLHQKCAEYAFRAGDRAALLAAYVGLSARLEETGEVGKAAAVRQRVRDLDPAHPSLHRTVPTAEAPRATMGTEYVDLGELILGNQLRHEGTRFVVPEEEPTGDEDRDFADMLAQFKTMVEENIAVEDSASHFDLGLAFKEMGLVDEAIGQFQVALRGGADPLATLEVLGQCFSEKGQFAVASRVLERALRVRGASDGDLVGVLYELASCEEALGREDAAREHYERVLAVDVRFRDASERLAVLSRR